MKKKIKDVNKFNTVYGNIGKILYLIYKNNSECGNDV